jgi:hypothetical protein
MYILGNYIFLNDQGKGIHIINNANPSNPVNEAYVNIPGCEDMAVTGNTLYADCYTDLMTIDISNPQDVKLKNVIPNIFPDRQYVLGYKIDSGKVISEWIIKDTTVKEKMELGRFYGGPVFMDVFSQGVLFSNYSQAGTKATQGKGGSMARFAIQAQHLYSVTTNKLNVLDIARPEAPQVKKIIDLNWGIETIYPFRDKLFIGSSAGMQIFSINNPSNPEKEGEFGHVRSCDPVIADDNYAYVTLRSGSSCQGFTNELDVLNIANVTSPSLVKAYQLQNPRGLSKDGKWLFICDGTDGLKLFDASDASNIVLKQTIDIGETYDVICMNGLAIVSAKDDLYQYDYTDINNIKLLSKIGLVK